MPTFRLIGLLTALLLPWSGHAQQQLPGVAPEARPGGPLTLEQCIRLAWQRNVQARRADLNTASGQANLAQARAARYPTLNGTGGYTYSSGRSIDPGTNQFVNQAVGSLNTGLSSSVTLFNGGQLKTAVRQSATDLAAARLDAEATRRDLALQVTQAYVAILQAREQQQTARIQLLETEAQLQRTRQLLAAGSVPATSVLQVQAQQAADQLTLTNADNTLATSQLTLLQLLEEPARPDFEIEQPTLAEPQDDEQAAPEGDSLFATSLRTQPQVRASALRAASAALGVRVARGQYLPRLALSGSLSSTYSTALRRYSYQTDVRQQVVGFLDNNPALPVYGTVPVTTATAGSYPLSQQLRDNFNPSVGVSLSVPILNNGQVRRTVQRATIAEATAALDELTTRNQLRKNVEQAVLDLQAARRRYASARDQLRFQEQAYRNTDVKYRLGAANAQDLLVEKNKFAGAQSSWTQARYEYVLRRKVLDFYQGKPLTL